MWTKRGERSLTIVSSNHVLLLMTQGKLTVYSGRSNDHTCRAQENRYARVISQSEAPSHGCRGLSGRPGGLPPAALPQSAETSHIQGLVWGHIWKLPDRTGSIADAHRWGTCYSTCSQSADKNARSLSGSVTHECAVQCRYWIVHVLHARRRSVAVARAKLASHLQEFWQSAWLGHGTFCWQYGRRHRACFVVYNSDIMISRSRYRLVGTFEEL